MLRWPSNWVTMKSMFFLLLLAGFCVNGEVFVDKKHPSSDFLVDKKELIFDSVDLGNPSDYPESDSLKFDLDIGGCTINIKAVRKTNVIISYDITGPNSNLITVNGLTKIEAIEGKNVAFCDAKNSQEVENCKATFTPTNDKYSVRVKLDGDVPKGLVLKATEAEAPATTSAPESNNSSSGPNYGLIFGCVGGAVFILIALSIAGGIVFWRIRRKRQAKQKEQLRSASVALVEEGGKAQDAKTGKAEPEVKPASVGTQSDVVDEKKQSAVEEDKKEGGKKEESQKGALKKEKKDEDEISKKKDDDKTKRDDTKKETSVRESQKDVLYKAEDPVPADYR